MKKKQKKTKIFLTIRQCKNAYLTSLVFNSFKTEAVII